VAPEVIDGAGADKDLGCNPENINGNFSAPEFGDNCDTELTITSKDEDGGEGCYKWRTRTWTATDDCGNTATGIQKLSWKEDTQAPMVDEAEGEDKDLGCNPSENEIAGAFKAPTWKDNCDAELKVSSRDGEISIEDCKYSLTRYWKAEDGCGNVSAEVSQTISWKVDKEAPVLSGCPQSITVKCYADVPAPASVTALDACDGVREVSYSEQQSKERSSCGNVITRTWWASDECGNSTSCVQTITVNDDVAPEVIDGAGDDKDLGCNPENINGNFSAPEFGDNCDTELTITSKDEDGGEGCYKWRTRTWTATDDCGNTATDSQKLSWKEDTQAPTFDNAPADSEVKCSEGLPEVPAVTATDNCDQVVVKYDGQTGPFETGNCNEYYYNRTWSVADGCGNTATYTQKIVVLAEPPVFKPETLPEPEITVECGTEPGPLQPEATICTVNGDIPAVVDGPEVSEREVVEPGCKWKYTRTWTAKYPPSIPNCPNPPTAQFVQTVYVVDTKAPEYTSIPEQKEIKCDEEVVFTPPTATDVCTNATIVQDGEDVITPIDNCEGGYKQTITRTWYAVDDCGNKAEPVVQVIYVKCCEAYCTYTQGQYGTPGGKACDGETGGLSTKQLIDGALAAWPGNTWTIGKPGRSLVISDADANWIIEYLPGGGASKALKPGDCNISDANCMKFNLRNGQINNTLLAQTITLGLNLGLKGELGSLQLKSGMYLNTGDLEGGCGSKIIKDCKYDIYGNVTYSPYHSYMLPASVIDYLAGIGKANVAGLFELANNLLGGDAAPAGVSLADVASAEDILNNAFDECKGFAGWSAEPVVCPPLLVEGVAPSVSILSNQSLTVKAFPNPYDENITFVIKSTETGRGKLNLFNLRGEQVSTVFDGNVEANRTMTITYKVPPLQRQSLVYHFSIGKKIETGKLIRPN
jgi:hypothetical protein